MEIPAQSVKKILNQLGVHCGMPKPAEEVLLCRLFDVPIQGSSTPRTVSLWLQHHLASEASQEPSRFTLNCVGCDLADLSNLIDGNPAVSAELGRELSRLLQAGGNEKSADPDTQRQRHG